MTAGAAQTRPALAEAGPTRLANGLTSAEYDSVKGLLVLLIVLGHNTLLSDVAPALPDVLYAFHVYAFLLLPFLFPSHRWTLRFAVDRTARYLVPYAAFYLLAAALTLVTLKSGGALGARIQAALAGLLLGTADPIKRGCGFLLYWFLPALWSVALLRAAVRGASPALRGGALAASILFFLWVGGVPRPLRMWMWMGSGIALFVYPLGLATAWLWSLRARVSTTWIGIVAGVVFVALSAAALRMESSVRLARLVVPTAGEPVRVLLHAAIPLAATIAALAAARLLARVPGMVAIGRHSLVIYLAHSLVFQGLLRVFGGPGGTREALLAAGGASFAVTVAIALAVAIAIERVDLLRRTITPRTASEWPLARLARRATRLQAPTS